MDRVRSAQMSWRQVEASVRQGAAAIFPMGSTEEHGPHAPMGDYMEDITPPSGSLGDPLLASAEKGERIVQRAVEGLVRFMSWFKGINPCVEPG
jgi:creatinine amidohydrolase/Fe(II)-dependent formamide hydrolase-like protein